MEIPGKVLAALHPLAEQGECEGGRYRLNGVRISCNPNLAAVVDGRTCVAVTWTDDGSPDCEFAAILPLSFCRDLDPEQFLELRKMRFREPAELVFRRTGSVTDEMIRPLAGWFPDIREIFGRRPQDFVRLDVCRLLELIETFQTLMGSNNRAVSVFSPLSENAPLVLAAEGLDCRIAGALMPLATSPDAPDPWLPDEK